MKRFCPFARKRDHLGPLCRRGSSRAAKVQHSRNQVVVNSPSHWGIWEFAEGTLEITSSGELLPRRWHRPINAVLDIVDHLRWSPPEELADRAPAKIILLDAVQGVSNLEEVVNAFDGDMTTFWEPEL